VLYPVRNPDTHLAPKEVKGHKARQSAEALQPIVRDKAGVNGEIRKRSKGEKEAHARVRDVGVAEV
jgi:hypothetical protein